MGGFDKFHKNLRRISIIHGGIDVLRHAQVASDWLVSLITALVHLIKSGDNH